jgi:hypothetical protein
MIGSARVNFKLSPIETSLFTTKNGKELKQKVIGYNVTQQIIEQRRNFRLSIKGKEVFLKYLRTSLKSFYSSKLANNS